MGGRNAFIDVDTNNFEFKDGGKTFYKIDAYNNVDILIRKEKLPYKAPEYSKESEATYAIIQNGKIKHIAFYKNHKQIKCIDLLHPHNQIEPHIHYNLDHTTGFSVNEKEDIQLINTLKRRYENNGK